MNLTKTHTDVCEILITSILPARNAAFGKRTDTGESCYLSASIVANIGIKEGHLYEAKLRPNLINSDKTPWFVIYVAPAAGPSEAEERIRELLFDDGGVWTPDELAEHSGAHAGIAESIAERFFRDRKLAKFLCFIGPGNATRVWYTASPDRADVDEWEDAE